MGRIDDLGRFTLSDVERYLIWRYGSEMNRRAAAPIDLGTAIHDGNLPESIVMLIPIEL